MQEFESSIVSKARDAITIETTIPEDYSSIGSSRFGGFPDLPSPDSFPETNGAYWIFLAQINLAEIAPINDYLPRGGLLSFFVDSTESLNARVLFNEGSCEHLSTVRHSGAEEMFAPDGDYTKTPHRLKFTRVSHCRSPQHGDANGDRRPRKLTTSSHKAWTTK